jgi:hypothetical protein
MPLVPGPGQLLEVLGGRADGSGGRLCLSRFLAIVLLASFMRFSPLAHANPPNPVWVPGCYEGGMSRGTPAASPPTLNMSPDGPRLSQALPPPPSPVPPNTSRITGTVLKHSVWPPGSLRHATPPLLSEDIVYSLALEVGTSRPERQGAMGLAQSGSVIEVFSVSAGVTPDLIGKKIQATVTLTGDTRGTRWWLSDMSVLP